MAKSLTEAIVKTIGIRTMTLGGIYEALKDHQVWLPADPFDALTRILEGSHDPPIFEVLRYKSGEKVYRVRGALWEPPPPKKTALERVAAGILPED